MTVIRCPSLLLSAAVLLAAASSATVSVVSAYSVLPQRASSFGGRSVLSSADFKSSSPSSSAGAMTMKKGKANLPSEMRSQYARAGEMEAYRKEMMESQRFGTDGFPVFNLYVRTQLRNMWYPCGSFKGDEKSQALCKNYADDGMMAGISKNQLDAGVAGSLYRDVKRLTETIKRQYPQLRKEKGELEFGYKLSFDGLSKEQLKIQVVEVKEQKGWFDGIKSAFSGE